jgi:hypothetical protein
MRQYYPNALYKDVRLGLDRASGMRDNVNGLMS